MFGGHEQRGAVVGAGQQETRGSHSMHSMHSMHSTHERRVAATKSVRGATWGGMGGAVTRGSVPVGLGQRRAIYQLAPYV